MKNSCLFYHHKLNIQLFHESIQLVPKNQNNTINISRTALQDLNITDSVNCSVNHWMISLYLPPLGPSRASSPPPPLGGTGNVTWGYLDVGAMLTAHHHFQVVIRLNRGNR